MQSPRLPTKKNKKNESRIKLFIFDQVYTPQPSSCRAILTTGSKIDRLYEEMPSPKELDAMEVMKTEVYSIPGIASPGFLDPHVHVAGGGGEDRTDASSRTNPISTEQLVDTGVTGVIGLRGTDTTGITMENVTHRLGILDAHGISVGYFNGGYTGPEPLTKTMQGDMKELNKPPVFGIKIAYADHRSPITIESRASSTFTSDRTLIWMVISAP
jgi:beta-aspartyl-dipeptidase (metallo-type)